MKWQQVATILLMIISGTGVLTYTNLFGTLFQLNGVSYNDYGDLYNVTYKGITQFDVNTTYWNICFEHPTPGQRVYIDGDGKLLKTTIGEYPDTVLYKKSTYGRVLYVNLNKVNNLVTVYTIEKNGSLSSADNVKVFWEVPTTGGKTRPIKDGDCWTRGKVNKNYLIFEKYPIQTIKWSFAIDGYVDIDPIIYGVEPTMSCDEVNKDKIDYVDHYKNETYCYNLVNEISCKEKYDIYNKSDDKCYMNATVCIEHSVFDYTEEIKTKVKSCKEKTKKILYADEIFEFEKKGYSCTFPECDVVCKVPLIDGKCPDLPDYELVDGITKAKKIKIKYTDKIEVVK